MIDEYRLFFVLICRRGDVPLLDGAQMIRQATEMVKDPMSFQAQKEAVKNNYDKVVMDEMGANSKKVSKVKVPLTLVHGDLNAMNTVWKKNASCNFLDFEATCISYPFLDAYSFTNVSGAEDDDIDFYLELWLQYETKDRLRELFDAMKAIQELVSVHFVYEEYCDSEECHRLLAYGEMTLAPAN